MAKQMTKQMTRSASGHDAEQGTGEVLHAQRN